MSKEINPSKERKENNNFEIVFGRKMLKRLETFKDSCKSCLRKINGDVIFMDPTHTPVEELLKTDYKIIRSLTEISEEMDRCLKENVEFEITPTKECEKNGLRTMLYFESRKEGREYLTENGRMDINSREFGFLFSYLYRPCEDDIDEDEVEKLKNLFRNGKTVILKYDKNKD